MSQPLGDRIVLVALGIFLLCLGVAVAGVEPGSQLVTCDQADTRVTITASGHLDPSCTWTRGVEITASDVTLDCQGARIAAPDRRYGVLIIAPIDVALSNITVRNCHIEGFLNNVHIERDGFFGLAELDETEAYEHAFSNILIEDSTSLDSRGVGIFVDGFVTGVTLRNLRVEGSGSAGIYLEAGSKDNVVENNQIVDNGYGENGPSGQPFDFGGVTFWFWGTGREGLAIDGSRFNLVRNNVFSGNAAGGIFLYKNCGEFVNTRPNNWWTRLYGANGNLIEDNSFIGQRYGIWIGSRMSANVLPMDCSDPAYLPGFVLDYASDNVVRGNTFQDVTFGVRVEDDGSVIEDNRFLGSDPAHQAVIVGTQQRTSALGLPVDETTIAGNQAWIDGNVSPYRWVHGEEDTAFGGNDSLGRRADFCAGEPPATGPFVMTVAVALYDPENPPSGDPPTLPEPEPLAACAPSCAGTTAATRSRIRIRRLDTPPGDDALKFAGEVTLPYPFTPPLDPATDGLEMIIADAAGSRLLDVVLPGGGYDRDTRVGWKTARRGNKWTYVNRSAAPPGGIARVVVRDRSSRSPGLVQFVARGVDGSYAVDEANLPLTGLVALQPPAVESAQCALATFPSPAAACRTRPGKVYCR
jgi:parallel beta-helix repeat protein